MPPPGGKPSASQGEIEGRGEAGGHQVAGDAADEHPAVSPPAKGDHLGDRHPPAMTLDTLLADADGDEGGGNAESEAEPEGPVHRWSTGGQGEAGMVEQGMARSQL